MRALPLSPIAILLALSCSHSPEPRPAPADKGWIARSDAHAQVLLNVLARFEPERAGELGVSGVDTEVGDLAPGHFQRQRQAWADALAQLQQLQKEEPAGPVAQDLAILVDSAGRRIRRIDLTLQYEVPYSHLSRRIFTGVKGLLDPQVAPERRPAALARVRKYAGLDGGRSWVELAEAETREGLAKPGLLPPARLAVENDLETAPFLIDGVDKLFQKYDIPGREEPLKALRQQLTAYLDFVRLEVLPRTRSDYRLPPELYAFDLVDVGVDIPAAELTARAHAAFTEVQQQMQKLVAPRDYRDVIRALKKEQIPDDQVLAFYQKRLTELEGIIRAHDLVTLPQRAARIRLGTPAENAQQPAPHMVPARFIGNTGEQGEFVLPLSVPGGKDLKYDDFNFDAAAWTLTAHEARPGHELQFSRMVEDGTSLARGVFAFNSVNVEGWGLYAEAISLPYMPDEGKLISLQLRLQRAARAFLDPELQSGAQTPESALQLLQRDVVLSPAFAKEEVDRYTFRMPAQATAYFYGYTKLLELRKAVEQARGPQFDARTFHDQILAQGVLPPNLMRQAILSL